MNNQFDNSSPEENEKTGAKKGRFKSELFDWGESLVISLTVVILIFVFLVRLIGVDGHSMEPTLHDKDQILMTNLFYKPSKGDIVVLTKESFMDSPIVKRVIATEGDTVNVDYEKGEVTVNGEVLDEPYIKEHVSTKNMGDMSFPATVPDGCIFVMGDNRNNSTDSRFLAVGMVDERYVMGHVILRIFPFNSVGTIS